MRIVGQFYCRYFLGRRQRYGGRQGKDFPYAIPLPREVKSLIPNLVIGFKKEYFIPGGHLLPQVLRSSQSHFPLPP